MHRRGFFSAVLGVGVVAVTPPPEASSTLYAFPATDDFRKLRDKVLVKRMQLLESCRVPNCPYGCNAKLNEVRRLYWENDPPLDTPVFPIAQTGRG